MIRKTAALFLALALLFPALFSCGEEKVLLRATVLAVGKADCIVLETGSHTVMIDTGEADNLDEITSFLGSRGIASIDALILTHFDKDHIGCAADLVRAYEIGAVYQSAFEGKRSEYTACLAACAEKGIEPVRLTEKASFTLDGAAFTIWPPEKTSYEKDEDNNASLITACRCGASSLLFCGDAMEERMAEFLSLGTGAYDFVKLPHHGSYLKNYEEIAAALQMKYAAITCSKKNREDEDLVAFLKEKGVKVFLTRGGNAVTVTVYENSLSVS